MTAKPKHEALINYKSGIQVVVRCSSFKVSRNPVNGGLTVEWSSDADPIPLTMGVDNIESIWQVK